MTIYPINQYSPPNEFFAIFCMIKHKLRQVNVFLESKSKLVRMCNFCDGGRKTLKKCLLAAILVNITSVIEGYLNANTEIYEKSA